MSHKAKAKRIQQQQCKKENAAKVVCAVHGVTTTWGQLDYAQRIAVECDIDTLPKFPCVLLPKAGTK